MIMLDDDDDDSNYQHHHNDLSIKLYFSSLSTIIFIYNSKLYYNPYHDYHLPYYESPHLLDSPEEYVQPQDCHSDWPT
jgi:hypothetical protein